MGGPLPRTRSTAAPLLPILVVALGCTVPNPAYEPVTPPANTGGTQGAGAGGSVGAAGAGAAGQMGPTAGMGGAGGTGGGAGVGGTGGGAGVGGSGGGAGGGGSAGGAGGGGSAGTGMMAGAGGQAVDGPALPPDSFNPPEPPTPEPPRDAASADLPPDVPMVSATPVAQFGLGPGSNPGATLVDGASWNDQPSPAGGANTGSVTLGGGNDHVRLSVANLPTFSAPKTVSFWYWMEPPLTARRYMVVFASTGNAALEFLVDSGTPVVVGLARPREGWTWCSPSG